MQDNTVYDNFISYVQFYLSRNDKERGLKSNPLNCYKNSTSFKKFNVTI